MSFSIPAFRPHLLLRGGHRQTLAASYPWRRPAPYQARPFRVALHDGDQLIIHDDCPPEWPADGPLVLLAHGLGGCHLSPYVQRLSERLVAGGARTWRLDLRGFGHSVYHCRHPGHAGRSGDLHAVLKVAAAQHPRAPCGLVGFSLSANMVLKLLGESPEAGRRVRAAAAVAPPIDLLRCAENMTRGLSRIYSRKFVGRLLKTLREQQQRFPEFREVQLTPPPLHLIDFDERVTAPLSGYRSARHYYAECSSQPLLSQLSAPTFVLAAADDPLIPADMFERVRLPGHSRLHVAPGGGHVGFFGRRSDDPDCFWMDWRLLDWLASHGLTAQR